MQTHIQKWGNSLGVRIPIAFTKQLHLTPGCEVNIEIENDRIVILAPQYCLDGMLNSITKQNMHHLSLEDDATIGGEEW